MTTAIEAPEVFIKNPSSAVIPHVGLRAFDPITGYGHNVRDYVNQNPVSLESPVIKTRDYSISVYSNVNDTLYTQFQNNMIVPITYRPGLDYTKLKSYVDINSRDGIYIVERYTMAGVSKKAMFEYLEYYKNTRGLSYSDSTIREIKATIEAAITTKKRLATTEIRVLTYVPYNDVVRNQYTYINGPGVVIVHGAVPEELLHPYSPAYLEEELLRPVSDNGSVSVDIAIIDSDNKPFYFMLGSEVKTARPISLKKNSVLPIGCTVVTRRGNTIVTEEYISPENFEERGFYRSEELCATNGNKALVLEEAKHNLDLKKMTFELKKLEEANKKLLNDKIARDEIHKLDMAKRVFDFEHHKITKQMDLEFVLTKFKIDSLTKVTDIRIARNKLQQDLVKYEVETQRAIELHNMKLFDNGIRILETIFKLLR